MKLAYCGSAAWDWIGRKAPPQSRSAVSAAEHPAPVIYAPASSLNLTLAATHCSASHIILVDTEGVAYTFGRNDKAQCGHALASGSTPLAVMQGIVHAACGKSHSLLVDTVGCVWSAGDNKCGQLGRGVGAGFQKVVFSSTELVFTMVACGTDFSLGLTSTGQVYGWGSPQYGQLGDGSDHEYIAGTNRLVYDPQSPKLVKGLSGVTIVQLACGLNHSLALDDEGKIYTWVSSINEGCAGYGRLGLNESPPKDTMVPKEITGFKDRSNPVKSIACGSMCCMAVDSRDSLHLWGKWKNSGDGGQGTPWLYPKHFSGLSGWAVRAISAGNTSLFALAGICISPDTSTISWGQSCSSGELGHGADRPRSATNSVKVDGLEGIHVFSVSCGLGMTLFLIGDDDGGDLPLALEEDDVAVAGFKSAKRKGEGVIDGVLESGSPKKTKKGKQ